MHGILVTVSSECFVSSFAV